MTDASTAVATAHPNIALVKYWGKQDEELVLPLADSLSMTLDVFPTTTCVTRCPGAPADTVTMDGRPASQEAARRVVRFLDLVRQRSACDDRASVATRNTVPVGAGLASSASGFAALALAAAAAYGLGLDPAGLSRLARRGSGSAARSVFGGFALWHAPGPHAPDPDAACYAEPLAGVRVDAALVVVLLDTGPKSVSSREAMRRTVATSPLFPAWLAATRLDLRHMRAALEAGDLATAGEIAEHNALGMHATLESADPPVRYLTEQSHRVLEQVRALRTAGAGCWATMDAGPNVKVLCPGDQATRIAERLTTATGFPAVVARPGPAAALHPGAEAAR
ncbi:diphosphomevalonate decarboxylase [Streptomyces racemochromogenes]|uniref:diphosphomevalonate decarboxylase n=1 Tax=Streptomyces racemochromogenes TaxID=67353 RepID=A0ABW7PCD4_9ACTN